MAIKRKPHQTLFRIMSNAETEVMRFRAKDARIAKAEMRKQTALIVKQDPSAHFRLERYVSEQFFWLGV